MQKKILASTVLLSTSGFAASASADLASGTLGLSVEGNLNPACLSGGTYPSCTFGFDTTDAGSYFLMDSFLIPGVGGAIDGGATLLMLDGTNQSYNGPAISGTNPYAGGNVGPIADWILLGDIGTNTHAGLTVSNNDTEIDMSTWSMNWNTVAFIDVGGPGGVATLSCTGGVDANACEAGESFTLDYAAVIPEGDASGFDNIDYVLHLQGTVVNAVPVPAAIWLFGTGLLGLLGVARCKAVK